MGDVALRKATAADSEFAYLVKKAAFKCYAEKVWGWDEGEQRRLHERRFQSRDFRVVVHGGKDVGVAAVVAGPDCLEVKQLFILPEHQGVGIGAKCMSLLAEEARKAGLPIRLRVLKVNPRALAFYEREGYSRTGETDTHILMEKAV